jgi:hypothetical protein
MPEPSLVKLAEVLSLMVSPPNYRERPLPTDPPGGFAFWFDGGAAERHTGGGTRYTFSDGTRAWQPFPWEPGYPDVEVEFPDGSTVSVRHRPPGPAEQGLDRVPLRDRPKGWHCVFCGWRCDDPGNDYLCRHCGRVRPFVGGSATLAFCPACGQGNLALSAHCEWCGAAMGEP